MCNLSVDYAIIVAFMNGVVCGYIILNTLVHSHIIPTYSTCRDWLTGLVSTSVVSDCDHEIRFEFL